MTQTSLVSPIVVGGSVALEQEPKRRMSGRQWPNGAKLLLIQRQHVVGEVALGEYDIDRVGQVEPEAAILLDDLLGDPEVVAVDNWNEHRALVGRGEKVVEYEIGCAAGDEQVRET
ncbi:hypothetical protein ACTWPB_02730 [Nocardia sp. IBHARD005]|uniref:hypothetical protein n=1 Tax=Nocardia sp. IBHARD005 TaxID=3457765 RepID=UPI004058D484